MKKADVVIIGAGPAGAVCAYLLKKAGVNCVVVDHAQFPRMKVCGGGLTHKAYTLLERLIPQFRYDYKPVKHIKLMMEHEERCEFEAAHEIRVVDRKTFDDALIKEYTKIGGEFVKDGFARYEKQENGVMIVTMKSGKQYGCRYLVGADGANSQVRQQAIGNYTEKLLCMEQYVEEKAEAGITVSLSPHYPNGYYYHFPSMGHDVVGYGDIQMTAEKFHDVMREWNIPENKIKGAYIPLKEVLSGNDHVILIGDAGGFPNKITLEGLYYAFATGMNACKAIVQGVPFAEANKEIFKKKKREAFHAKMFYSRFGMSSIRLISSNTNFVKKCFDIGVER